MKKIVTIFALATTLLTLAGCQFDVSAHNGGADIILQTSINDIQSEKNNLTGSNFSVSSVTATTATITTREEIKVSFINGSVDISDENIANIKLYPLHDAATATSLFERSTEIPFTSYRVESSGSGTNVFLYYNLSGTNISTTLELEVSPTLTANNGVITLNQDADNVSGETNNDVYFSAISIATAPTALTTGLFRISPQTTISCLTFDGGLTITAGNLEYNITVADINGQRDLFTKDIFDAINFKLQTFNYNAMAYEDYTFASAYDSTTGIYSITATNVTDGYYRCYYQKNKIVENPYLGWSRSITNNNSSFEDVSSVLSAGSTTNATYENVTTTVDNIDYQDSNLVVRVTFSTTTANALLLDNTITNDSVLFYDVTGDSRRIEFTSAERVINSDVTVKDNIFDFYFNDVAGTLADDITSVNLLFLPTLMCDMATTDSTADDKGCIE